nr:hypothetical protein [Tanacetum cinerariifolium]
MKTNPLPRLGEGIYTPKGASHVGLMLVQHSLGPLLGPFSILRALALIYGTTKKSLYDEFEALMHKRFQMSSMRELTFFLGLQVKQSEEGIFISQDKYLKGQPKLGLWYPRDSSFDLEAYSDSDYARSHLDRKSTIGEYVDAANCHRQVLWIQNQMLDYGFRFMNTKIYIDNESTICNTEGNAEFHQIVDFLTSSSIIMLSLFIFDGMWRNLDGSKKKFLMYPIFLQTFLKNQSPDLVEPLNDVYVPPTLTKKVFSNMIRKSENFSGTVTLLFASMLAQLAVVKGKGLGNPPESQPTSSPAQPISKSQIPKSSSSPKNTQSPRKTLEGTGFSHARGPNFPAPSVDVEAVHKEGVTFCDLRLSTGKIVRSREDMMEHAIELTDHVPQTPHDSPLLGGHTPGSDKGSMTQKELMNLCITLSQKVLDLENVKTVQANEIASLKKRVTKLEQRQSSRILGFHPFRAEEEVIVEDKGSGQKGGSKAETISTTRPDISAARPEVSTAEQKTPPTTTLFDDEDVTIADTLTKKRDQDQIERDATVSLKIQADLDEKVRIERERQEEASKAAIGELYDEVHAQIDADHELTARLTHEEQEKYTVEERYKLLAEFFKERKKQLAKERVEATRSKPPTKTQLRNLMMTYLKHTGRFTHAQLKSRSFEEIQKLYTKEHKWVDAFVPIGSEEDEKRVRSRKKRAACSSSKHKSPKKHKVNNQESVDSENQFRKCLKVVPDDDKVINYETLDVKSPIVDCESHMLETMDAVDVHVYKLTRLDGSYRHFSTFSRMLEVLDKQDVLDLYKIVMERFLANDPEGYDLILWGDLKTLMESSKDDEI